MNRRRLIFTVLGAFGVGAIATAMRTMELPVATSPKQLSLDVLHAMHADAWNRQPAIPTKIPITVPAVFEHQMSSVTTVLTTDELEQFGNALDDLAGGPQVSIGSLIISSEAEAQAFLARMAQAISTASGQKTDSALTP